MPEIRFSGYHVFSNSLTRKRNTFARQHQSLGREDFCCHNPDVESAMWRTPSMNMFLVAATGDKAFLQSTALIEDNNDFPIGIALDNGCIYLTNTGFNHLDLFRHLTGRENPSTTAQLTLRRNDIKALQKIQNESPVPTQWHDVPEQDPRGIYFLKPGMGEIVKLIRRSFRREPNKNIRQFMYALTDDKAFLMNDVVNRPKSVELSDGTMLFFTNTGGNHALKEFKERLKQQSFRYGFEKHFQRNAEKNAAIDVLLNHRNWISTYDSAIGKEVYDKSDVFTRSATRF